MCAIAFSGFGAGIGGGFSSGANTLGGFNSSESNHQILGALKDINN